MPLTLPLPLRIAAGVLATGLDRLRHLPEELPTLPVTIVGQAVRASMRVQQEIVQLASRGDEMLAGITSRPSERPEWARFDDEEGDASPARPETGEPAEPDGSRSGPVGRRARSGRRAVAAGGTDGTGPAGGTDGTGPAGRHPITDPAQPDDPDSGGGRAAAGAGTPGGPPDMPGYDDLRIAQVRARLRGLNPGAVTRLLDYEQSRDARAPYLTLLTNRLTTLQGDPAQESEA